MGDSERIIAEIKKAMAEHSSSALAKTEGDAFAFGHVCGYQQALRASLEIVEGVLDESDSAESSFSKNLKGTRK